MKAKDSGTIDLWDILHLLRSHAGKIAFCVLLSVAAGLYYLAHALPVYASTVLLEVAPNPAAADKSADLSADDLADVQRTIELKLTSPAVLWRVIQQNHLDTDPAFTQPSAANALTSAAVVQGLATDLAAILHRLKADRYVDLRQLDPPPAPGAAAPSEVELVHRLAGRVTVTAARGSRLISLTVDDRDPQKARQLAQSIIDEFYQESFDERRSTLAASRNLLLAEVRRDSDALRTAEEKLEAYRKKYNAVSLEDQQNIVVDRLRELNQQVAEAQDARLARESDAQQVRRMADTDPEQLLSLRSVAEAPEVVDLRKQVALQEAAVATLAKRYGPLHPTMIQAQSELRTLHQALDASIQKAGNRIVQTYESARQTEDFLRAALAAQEHASMQLAGLAIPYHALERDVQADAAIYGKVLAALKQMDVTQSLMVRNDVDGLTVRTIGRPLAPTRPARPRRKLVLALSMVAGLFLGCGSALVARALDNTVSSVDGAEDLLHLPVLTTVPRSRHQRLASLPVVARYPRSGVAEAYRSLRTSLAALPREKQEHGILFTSAIPGEGKTYCSLNTATALAQQGFKTLLIDGDLRRPRLQRILVDWNEQPGLADCLRRPDAFAAAVRPTAIRNLFCLGDRKSQPDAQELLGADGLGGVLQQARAGYDRVVIDSAPLLAVSDALCIARLVGVICLVIHAGGTPRRAILRAVRLLEEVARHPPTGVILNKVDRRNAAGNYRYYSATTPS